MGKRAKDRFGFFIHDFNLTVGPYIVKPVRNHAAVVKKIYKDRDAEGFFYPPLAKVNSFSAKPIHLYPMPPTHSISRADRKYLPEDFRRNDGGFLIHLLGFLYECRAQFYDWKFDTRLPMNQEKIAHFNHQELEKIVNLVYADFSAWPPDLQLRYINILYMHCRASSPFWDWEQFMMEYTVTDAIWRFYSSKKGNHGERINKLCSANDILHKDKEVEDIVTFRNDLFHEALWDSDTPGFTSDGDEQIHALFNLRRLNQRLILAIAGIRSDFTRSDWTSKSFGSLF